MQHGPLSSAPAQPEVATYPEAWYNTSAGSGELNAYGVPRGFFRGPGMDSFPVLLDLNAPEARMRWLFAFLVCAGCRAAGLGTLVRCWLLASVLGLSMFGAGLFLSVA